MHRCLLPGALAASLAGCFSPDLQDGTIACGQAGCPPGMACADDGYCYASPPVPHVVLATASVGGNNRVFAYCDGTLREVWRADATRTSVAAAWGDADGDRVPELAIASDEDGLALYRVGASGMEQMGGFALPAPARALAWGDVDGDGRADLASAGSDAMHLLRWYDDRGLDIWWDSNPHDSLSVSIADVDGDGRDEVALGTRGESAIAFTSDGQGGMNRLWSDDSGMDASQVAWAGENDNTLAIGNPGAQIELFYAQDQGGRGGGGGGGGGYGGPDGTSPSALDASALAWGDSNNGRTLAVGTGAGLHLFVRDHNDNLAEVWASTEKDATRALAWSDVGLAVGNAGSPDRLYVPDGSGMRLVWSSKDVDTTASVAWGRWEGGPDPCAW